MFARNKLGMKVVGVDNHPDRENATSDERNRMISQDISEINADGVLIVGSNHLYGLLNEEQSKIDLDKFHVVPFNLTCIIPSHSRKITKESLFASQSDSVIQIRFNTFTDCKRVSERWNTEPMLGLSAGLKKSQI